MFWIQLERKGYKISMTILGMANRTMPVCLTADQFKKLQEIAKINGMVDAGQAVEKILREI